MQTSKYLLAVATAALFMGGVTIEQVSATRAGEADLSSMIGLTSGEVNLANQHLTDAMFRQLLRQLPTTQISSCNLTDCGLTDERIVSILNALPNTVSNLNLSGNVISFEIWNALVSFITRNHHSLTSLNLTLCFPGGEFQGGDDPFPDFTRLSFGGTLILSSNGIGHISQMPQNITSLDLSYCDFTDRGLARLNLPTTLRTLDLTGNHITPQAIATFRATHPNVTVTCDQ